MKELLEKIDQNLPANDKLKHFFLGFIIYFLSFLAFSLVGSNISFIFATLVALSFGIIKELIVDKNIGGHVSFWDVVYTILPALIIDLILYL